MDKGYSSQLNQPVILARGLVDGIMHKAARNRALSVNEKAANRCISSVQAKVERTFGTLKRGYGFFRTRYLGIPNRFQARKCYCARPVDAEKGIFELEKG